MELLNQYGSILVIITAIVGFMMAFGIGALMMFQMPWEHPSALEQLRLNKLF